MKRVLIVMALIFSIVCAGLGVKAFEYTHTPEYAARQFVKALLNGDEGKLNHYNYTNRDEQTIKHEFGVEFVNTEYRDFTFTSQTLDIYKAQTSKSNKYLNLYMIKIDKEWFVGSYLVVDN